MFCTLPEANSIHKKVPKESCEKPVTFEEFLWMEEEKRETISLARFSLAHFHWTNETKSPPNGKPGQKGRAGCFHLLLYYSRTPSMKARSLREREG
jgi:hypothetical protein